MTPPARRTLLRGVVLALAAVLSALLARCSGAPAGAKPNVLLITVDTLRLDRIGAYGGPPESTPSIDTLAGQGVRFASVQGPRGLTWPSLTTLLTGLQPRTHGVRANGAMLEEGFRTLPEVLRSAGWKTAGFLANMCDAPNRGLDEFFCAWWEKTGPPPRRTRFQWASHEQAAWDESVTRHAIEFIGGRHERPFFAWVHYIDPHKPFDPVPEFASPIVDGSFQPDDATLDALTLGPTPMTAAQRAQLFAIYDSQVKGVDAKIGRLLAALRDAGRENDTLVIFSADHGEELGDHAVYFHHLCSVYQQVLAVPLILRWPGQLPAGRVVEADAALVDATPTVLDLLGVPTALPFEGASRAGLARGTPGASGADATFSEWSDRMVIVGEGKWRYIWNPKQVVPECLPFTRSETVHFPVAAEELYDLESDPSQRSNVVASRPDRAAEMRGRACEFVTEKEFRRRNFDQVPTEVRERLESLGYLEGEVADTGPPLSSFCPSAP